MAEKTGIKELRLTTRDISDYDVLMTKRLQILKANRLTLADIQNVISTMAPLEGALDFINWVRSRTQIIILSDTFTQFAGPLMEKLGWPTLFCNELIVGPNGMISDYTLRQNDGKLKAAQALKSLNYNVIAIGDSYNDISMLQAADIGILFKPPENVQNEFPELPATHTYVELKGVIENTLE